MNDTPPTQQQKIVRPFEVTNRLMLAITIPVMLASLTTPLLGLVDTAVVGQLGDPHLLGGLAIGALVFDFLFSTMNFLRAGTTGLVAQAMGMHDKVGQQAVFWRSIGIALIAGIVFILATPLVLMATNRFMQPDPAVSAAMSTYVTIRLLSSPMALANYAVLGLLLGQGRAMQGLYLQFLLNGINIAMTIGLGLLAGWGVAGIAWGTVLGEGIALVVGLVLVYRQFRAEPNPTLAMILDPHELRRMFAVNRDIMLRSFFLLIAYAYFTRAGTTAGAVTLAANAVLMNFLLVSGYLIDGVTTAAEQISGRAVGAHYRPAFDRGVRLSFLWGLMLASAMALFFLAFGDGIIRFLIKSPEVQEMASTYMPWAALAPVMGLLAFHMDGVFIGATWSRDMRNMMLLSLAGYFAAYLVLPVYFGNHGLWLALHLFLGLRGISLLAILPSRARAQFAA
ncbi:MATE family efflux transporter [Phyllobacterium sp. 21LDTY02-6]|jgi:multidrug resistance protein, MATE family|uniref:MATE family efflux transporter n=1 Tax=unclassified Phyllobacterium TaxID=2638441 RepID=UPI0020218986|nr:MULTISPECIES: MATE family efflux transporter [unclassified Phyllobacterium]MCO4318786.1 MATE family efflux transporter [Phyllobacterium sp. 21LDTY02-6]MCX8281947.1 MATE family efflux transporter [Phyllobacterium sp. 0TCS1.6C]MCX8294410.1 MATE family efflux transporter [Phyllobacterium sp. 0TCS1.6A]